jgi:luciferase family oxidoreductase group 1
MDFDLSVLDVSPVSSGSNSTQALRNTLDLARLVDRLGYRRYWLAEHHNMPTIASSAPEVMIGHVANVTERIRVGAGVVMLPNHAPLKVAETFRVLETLHPGRVDLGIGRAPDTDPVTAKALRRSRDVLGAEDFPQRFGELLAFAGDGFSENHRSGRRSQCRATSGCRRSGCSAPAATRQGQPARWASYMPSPPTSARRTWPRLARLPRKLRAL